MLIIIYCLVSFIIIISCTFFNYNRRYLPGPRGPRGGKGDRGDKGEKGEKGSNGHMGQRGYRGLRGDNNSIEGIKGITGYVGEKGPKGFRGYRGFKGQTGDIGERGSKGTAGNLGLPGQDGNRGKPGEYDFSLLDEETCRWFPFNTISREMKCPYNFVLTGVKDQKDNYEGYCCKIKLNNDCSGKGLARKLQDHKPEMMGTVNEYKYATEEQQEEIYKYRDRYNNLTNLFYTGDHVCENDIDGAKIVGAVDQLRCCSKKQENNLNYLKYY